MKEKIFLHQFIPKEFDYLTKIKKISYLGENLKTDYLINILNELITKFYFTDDIYFNLWSVILRKKYGANYNTYIQYLIDKGFISMTSNYYATKKAKTYKLNINNLNVIRCKINDNILLKKYQKNYLLRSITNSDSSPIDLNLRKLLVDDLYHVNINYSESINHINKLLEQKQIDLTKYYKNLSSIDSVNTGHVFFKFDSYGRMHTNFTILKKYIRQNFLTIDGQLTSEIDIKNSQPFFLVSILKKEIGEENFNDEVKKYIDVVKNGLLYDELLENFPEQIHNRDEAKIIIYRVLFGNNSENRSENKLFRKLYPTVYNYIKEIKSMKNSYKELSHALQLVESQFIFGSVVKEIKEKFPHIRLFTIHDSIVFPEKYKEEVNIIFRKHLKNLI